MRHWCCCQDEGRLALCGTDLSDVPWAQAEEDVLVTAEITCCTMCIEMQAEAVTNVCPRYGTRCLG